MNRKKRIVYLILGLIPVLFLLFLLATINVLYMLLAVILILVALLVLKWKKPELFAWGKPKPEPEPEAAPETWREAHPSKVYMVLAGRENLDAQRIMVNKEVFTIGRDADNDGVIKGSRISRHHLRIEYDADEDACYVIDLDSANGTHLNSERMRGGQRYRLLQGDRLMIDDRTFIVEYAHY